MKSADLKSIKMPVDRYVADDAKPDPNTEEHKVDVNEYLTLKM